MCGIGGVFLFAGKKKTLQVFILKDSTVFSFPSLLRRLHLWLEVGPLAHQFKYFKTGIFEVLWFKLPVHIKQAPILM